MVYCLISPTEDAYENIALDEYLLNTVKDGEMVLLFYVNKKAVIIGRNQNPWLECNLDQLNADGVQLVRRVSGGGAVYHDAGNLNFSFICPENRYDEQAQTGVILSALADLGFHAEATGRNDIVMEGMKISGNAYCSRGGNRMRHGTLLIHSDLSVFDHYLSVSRKKLAAKGVKSVRARVTNLKAFDDSITREKVLQAILERYRQKYGEVTMLSADQLNTAEIEKLAEKNKSWEWSMGEAPAFDYSFENRFAWGMTQVCLTIRNGAIASAKVYTDALDETLSQRLEPLFEGIRFDKNEILKNLTAQGGEAASIGEYIYESFD